MGYRGRRKILKRVVAPKSWMLDKLGGVFAPRPSTGPHKLRECLPLIVFLRNRLKYALTGDEVKKIVKQRLIKIDGKVRTDTRYPCGFMDVRNIKFLSWKVADLFSSRDVVTMLYGVEKGHGIYRRHDVITIEKTAENFRLLYDVKGRFAVHRIKPEEAKYKLCRVKANKVGPKGVPFLVTNDGRTIRYPDPLVKVNDTIMVDIASGKIDDFIKFDSGNLCMITGGRNLGRVGTIQHRERHPGSFDIVHVKDSLGHTFATRLNYVFVIGKGNKAMVSLPRGKGVKITIAEERDRRLAAKTQ